MSRRPSLVMPTPATNSVVTSTTATRIRQVTLRLMDESGENSIGSFSICPVNAINVPAIRRNFNIADNDSVLLRVGKCYLGSDDRGKFIIPTASMYMLLRLCVMALP